MGSDYRPAWVDAERIAQLHAEWPTRPVENTANPVVHDYRGKLGLGNGSWHTLSHTTSNDPFGG